MLIVVQAAVVELRNFRREYTVRRGFVQVMDVFEFIGSFARPKTNRTGQSIFALACLSVKTSCEACKDGCLTCVHRYLMLCSDQEILLNDCLVDALGQSS